MSKINNYYALYHDDRYLTGGSIQDLANYNHISIKTIYYYMSKKHMEITKGKSYIVIKVEDDND